MAQIIVTETPVNLNVTTTQSNITVTDLETNVTVNVASLSSNISVTSTPVNVTISPSIGVSNSEIRAAISNTAPITYDVNNGIIGFDASATAITALSLNSTSTIQSTGNITSGDGLSVTNNATIGGNAVIQGSLTLNDEFIFAGDFNGNLKDISLSYYNAGNVSGNVTLDVANGIVQKIRLIGNLTGLTFTGIANSTPITLIIQQDNVGFWSIDTATYPSNWTNYKFVNNFKTLTTTANAYDLASISYDGTNYYTSVVNFVQTLITNGELANSNVIVNGTTINLGSSGNISHFGALTTSNLSEGTNLYFTAARVRGNVSAAAPLNYNSSTGQFGWADYAQIGGLNVNSTQGYSGVSLRVNKYTGGGTPNAMEVYGNATISEKLTVTGNVQGNYILGNGAFLTGVTSLTNAQVISYISSNPLTVGGNLTVNGNINATGNINVQNVEDLYVRDQTIVMNANAASPANVQIVSNRPGTANTMLKWNEQTDRWTFTNNGTTYYNMPESTTDLAEGANLYYTTARANTAIGAYQGNINTPGTVTAGVANVTTLNATGNVNATNLYATNNIVASAAYISDGANINYVRAYSADFVIESTATSLPVLMEAESNNRISKGDTALRYVPATKTLFVSDGTIGTNTNNVAGNNFLISGATTSFGNITTNATVQAGFFKGNGSQLTGIPANIVGSENINVTGNVVSLDNALSNVYSITTDGQNFTINSLDKLILTEQLKNVTTYTGNINGDGYAVFTGSTNYTDVLTHTGSSALNSYGFLTGSTTSGSNIITGVSLEDAGDGNPASISSVTPYYVFSYIGFTRDQYPFPPGTYVTSVDAGAGTITMSQPASATVTLTYPSPYTTLIPGAYDADTGLLIGLISEYTINGTGSRSTIDSQLIVTTGAYGYPATGPAPTDFVYSIDTASDYTAGIIDTSKLIARTNILAPRTVLSAPRGLVIGDSDLTNRAENDSIQSFGLNILWDGSSTSGDYAGGTPLTQILVKNYTDNNLQGSGSSALNRVAAGPRLFFTAAEGNKDEPYQITYPRENLELGRIAWWCGTNETVGLGSQVPPAFISVVTNRDMTGSHNGGVGMYLSASPNTDSGRRGLFTAHQLGNTLIASGNATTTGASQPITFAPMWTSAAQSATGGSNAVAQFNNTLSASNYQWATINYDNASGKTGSRLSVTNGVSTVSGRNGNLSLALDRNDNGAGFGNKEWAFKLRPGSNDLVLTEDDVVRTTFSGGNISATAFYGDGGNLTNVTATANTFENIIVAGQANVVAMGSTNLTLAAGSGMTITTDAALDIITFSSTGGYGNSDVAAFLAAYGSNVINTTGNVSAGAVNVDKIKIDPAAAVTADSQGEIVWNTTYGGLDVAMNGINLGIGQQEVFYGKLTEDVSKGNVIMFAGAQGDHFLLAKANVDAPGFIDEYIIGCAAEDGNTNDFIYVTTYGRIDAVDTQGFGAGNLLYLSTTTPGALTNIMPTQPDHAILIAAVAKEESSPSSNNGTIFVRPTFGKSHLDLLHDVKITTPANNQILRYDSGNTVWVNENLGTAITSANVKLKQFAETTVALGNVSGDISSNINVANGTIYTMTTTGNITINSLANVVAGTSATLIITQSTGNHTLSSTMKFAGASKTLSTAASAIDIVSVFYDGTTYYATLSKGYA